MKIDRVKILARNRKRNAHKIKKERGGRRSKIGKERIGVGVCGFFFLLCVEGGEERRRRLKSEIEINEQSKVKYFCYY